MPSDRFQLTAHYDFLRGIAPLNNSYIEVSGMLVRRQTHFPKGVDFAPPPEGYRLLDIETGGDVRWGERDISFTLTISNLLNSSYRDYLSRFRFFVDDPGRNIIMRIQIPYKCQSNNKINSNSPIKPPDNYFTNNYTSKFHQ